MCLFLHSLRFDIGAQDHHYFTAIMPLDGQRITVIRIGVRPMARIQDPIVSICLEAGK